MRSLSGTYRVGNREFSAIMGLRERRLSINQIADAVGRSTSTVHGFVGGIKNVDNRHRKNKLRKAYAANYNSSRAQLRMRIVMYLRGFFVSLKEALSCESVPVPLLGWLFKNENSGEEGGEDPS